MTENSINYDAIAHAAKARMVEEAKLEAAAAKLAGTRQVAHSHCSLCRRARRSPRAFYRGSQLCLSCHMRGFGPVFVVTDSRAVGRWRRSLVPKVSQLQFADLCGWSQPRQCAVESQHRLQLRSARKVATAFMKLLNDGHRCDLLLREWPAFGLISSIAPAPKVQP
jgi:hypothetical protein